MSAQTAGGERIASLDLIRGVAVMGIFSVNVVDFAMIEPAYFNPGAYGGFTGASLVIWAVNMLLVDGKMRALFSMLFGASMMLVADRAEAGGRGPWATTLRRLAVLALFGLAHYFLLWTGDILFLYAFSGLIAFGFRRKSVTKLLVIGSIFLALSAGIMIALALYNWQADLAAHAPGATAAQIREWNQSGGWLYPDGSDIARDLAAHRWPWHEIVELRLRGWPRLVGNTVGGSIETIGLMLIGMAAFRSGFFTGEWDGARYRRAAMWGIGLGLGAHAALVVADIATRFYSPLLFGGFMGVMTPFRVFQALGYAALLILLLRRGGAWTGRVAAVGRMAFSNYLGTSLITSLIFFSWGLGLYGTVTRWEAWAIAVPLVWALMLLWSKPWLERFHYGPLEWAWRSLSRGRAQPMRKRPAAPADLLPA